MATTQTLAYVPREWNDDDRVNDYISYHYDDTVPHVPVYKILKEMYDEDKAKLYHYDLEEEYIQRYGEVLFEDIYEYGYYQDMYSDYYDIYSVTSGVASDIEVIEDSDDEDYRKADQEAALEALEALDAIPSSTTNDVDEGGNDERGISTEPYQAKFIYL